MRRLCSSSSTHHPSFVALRRACAKKNDLHRGNQVHADILKRGLNHQSAYALVSMYAKCGALTKAQDLLNGLYVRDVLSWTALIAGYAQHGQPQNALNCFEQMQHEGLSPDAVTFICTLKACATMREAHKGEEIHNEIAKQGLLKDNLVLGTALVDMYAKCGALAKAQRVLDELRVRDVVAWNALIAGYAQQGQQAVDALKCFKRMQHEGVFPNEVTFTFILKACGTMTALDVGEEIHHKIAEQGIGNDRVLGNALVDMYTRCGAFAKAEQVLEELQISSVVSWSAVIKAYAQQGLGEEALACFERMENHGISPDAVTFTSVLKACGSIGAANKGEEIHDEIVKQGLLGNNVVLGTALMDMYVKCGALSKARRVLEDLPFRDTISWNSLIAGYAHQGQGHDALVCFERMQCEALSPPNAATFTLVLKACGSIGAVDKGEQIHDEIVRQGLLAENTVIGNALVDMYVKCGALATAEQVLEELPGGDVVAWSALIAGYAQQGQGEEALDCFERMQQKGLTPDAVAFTCTLKACGIIRAVVKGEAIHDEVVKQGLLEKNLMLGNALVDMYVKCGALAKARGVLEELPVRDVISWSTLVAGYAQEGQGEEALNCFKQMKHEGLSPNEVSFLSVVKACGSIGVTERGKEVHDEILRRGLLCNNNVVLGTALVDMYAKCGDLEKAQEVHDGLTVRDVVAWSALISGYAQQSKGEEALKCFKLMQREGFSPNAVTFICILKACGSLGATNTGEQIHKEVATQGLLRNNITLGNALVDMYVKCGALAKAQKTLEELPVRNVISWNTLIAGYAQKGQGGDALSCYEHMQREGLSPEASTFTCILKACGSIGATDIGAQIHYEIARQGLLGNDNMLGTALVDMYAKCGALVKARQVVEELPVGNVICWNALIAGYAQQGQGQHALECIEQMQGQGISPDTVTISCMLSACRQSVRVDEGETLFAYVSRKIGIKPEPDHYTHMVDLFAHAGHLDKAVAVIERMPSFDQSAVWSTLLNACWKWGNVNAGKWAFEHAVHVLKEDRESCLCG